MGATEHSAPLLQNRRSPRGAASLEGKWKAGGRASTTVRLPPSTRARQGRPGQGRTPSAVRHKRNPGDKAPGHLLLAAELARCGGKCSAAGCFSRCGERTPEVKSRDRCGTEARCASGLDREELPGPGNTFEFVVAAVVELEARSGDEHLIRDPILPDPREPRRRNLAPCHEPTVADPRPPRHRRVRPVSWC